MSIVLAADVERMSVWMLGAMLVASLITLGITTALGAFRPRLPDLLTRQFGPAPLTPFVINGIMAVVVFFAAQTVAVLIVIALEGGLQGRDPKELIGEDYMVWIALASHGPAAIAMLLGLCLIPGGFDRIGLKRPIFGSAIGVGLIVAAMPALLVVMGATEWVYYFVGYKHEPAHELLQAMKPDNRLVQVAAIVAAVIAAPLSEELFFRGHVQTLVRRLMAMFITQPVPPQPPVPPSFVSPDQPPVVAGFPPPPPPPPGDVPIVSPVPVIPVQCYAPPPAVPAKSFWPSLIAVLITSALFAVVHPAWSWPPIFVLSLALGFAYERTGSLWAPIAMHAVFNGTMTGLYLLQMAQAT